MSDGPKMSLRRAMLLCVISLIGIHCDRQPADSGEPGFTVQAVYSGIRSYPGGGGLFLIRINPETGFSGDVVLSVNADSRLHAAFLENPLALDDSGMTAEISLWPEAGIPVQNYELRITAAGKSHKETMNLHAEILEWDAYPPSEDALQIRETFIQWIQENVPGCGQLAGEPWENYMTYPQILIVEHWTSISPRWEMRFCFHVMVPPYDWSMVRLRPRGKADPVIVAKRESGGDIHTIPEAEYPVFDY